MTNAHPADSKIAAAGYSLTVWHGADGREAFPAELPADVRRALALALCPEVAAVLDAAREVVTSCGRLRARSEWDGDAAVAEAVQEGEAVTFSVVALRDALAAADRTP